MDATVVGASEKDSPAQVAEQGFRALMKGEAKVVAGSLSTKTQEAANAVLPDAVKAAAHRTMTEPGSTNRWATDRADRQHSCRWSLSVVNW